MEQDILTVTVSEVNHYIRRVIEHNGYLKDICIKGEISNFKAHPTGHLYLTLKDEGSTLRSVMFRSQAEGLHFLPENGMKVRARGRISVYEAGGTYQLYIDSLEPEGEGDLYAAFEKLKQKLEAEGLFDPALKKPIPAYPRKICVITASSGAALQDILQVLKRRYTAAEVVLIPVMVQGEGAKEEIAAAISLANRLNVADVIITGRGGGSIEDLWAFNEEVVARAIASSHIPVISAVGHETDFTIADFVSDLRAPTPSAAAELAVPSKTELLASLAATENRLKERLKHIVAEKQHTLSLLKHHPTFIGVPKDLEQKKALLSHIEERSRKAIGNLTDNLSYQLIMNISKLEALSPLSALTRGFSYASLPDGTCVRKKSQLKPGTTFTLRVSDGTAECSAIEKK